MKYKMKNVKLSDIQVGKRFREDLGDIDELVASIQEKGLIQPLCVNEDMQLLAGGRRHAALTRAGVVDVPVLVRAGSDEADAREIELMENIHRKEMTWQEQAKLTAEIHRLYSEKHSNWSGNKTAEILDKGAMTVSRALQLNAALEANPAIGECKSAADAYKVIKKVEEDAIVKELAARQKDKVQKGLEDVSGGKMDRGVLGALHIADQNYRIGDTFAGMAALADEGNIDLIECDPPYGVDLAALTKREDQGADTKNRDCDYYEIPTKDYPEFLDKLTKELYRVGGKNCWMVFWFAFRWYPEVVRSLQEAGWKIDYVPAMWVKDNGRTPRPDLLLARSYEPFIVCRKGIPTIVKQGGLNTFISNPEKNKYHPAQRPVGLMEDILDTFVDEGRGTILVPFAGSGATFRAAYNRGHRVFGWDSNNEYKDKFLLAVEEDSKRLLSKE